MTGDVVERVDDFGRSWEFACMVEMLVEKRKDVMLCIDKIDELLNEKTNDSFLKVRLGIVRCDCLDVLHCLNHTISREEIKIAQEVVKECDGVELFTDVEKINKKIISIRNRWEKLKELLKEK